MGDYYRLAKPGIVYGNALPAIAAFFFASARSHFDLLLFVAMLIGLSACIASACVINNVIDRDIDACMERTKARAIPMKRISVRSALIFASALLALGCAAVFFFTNLLTLAVTLFGVFAYLCLYTPLKRMSLHSTIVGALAGAVPPVVGYVAVTDALDTTAIILFLILVCWQMAHFFAIAIYRLAEYREAGLPVMPVRIGILPTKAAVASYTFLFAYAAYALYAVQHLGMLYALTLGALSIFWIGFSLNGFFTRDTDRWARRIFLYSLVVIVLFSLVLAVS